MTENTKGWTPERRQAARERILKNKPWEKSTGPRTLAGKARSSMNAYKDGMRSEDVMRINRYITHQKAFTKQYKDIKKLEETLLVTNVLMMNLFPFKEIFKDELK